jgi:hypothetical protein
LVGAADGAAASKIEASPLPEKRLAAFLPASLDEVSFGGGDVPFLGVNGAAFFGVRIGRGGGMIGTGSDSIMRVLPRLALSFRLTIAAALC